MQLRTFTRRIAALGLIGALALVLAIGQASFVGAQATPDATPAATGGDTSLPNTGTGTTAVNQATPGVGGDTSLPNTGTGSTAINQATPGVGGDTTLPSTGTGAASETGMTGLFTVLAAAAAVIVAAVAGRTFLGRRNS
jgi:hypothetical protein